MVHFECFGAKENILRLIFAPQDFNDNGTIDPACIPTKDLREGTLSLDRECVTPKQSVLDVIAKQQGNINLSHARITPFFLIFNFHEVPCLSIEAEENGFITYVTENAIPTNAGHALMKSTPYAKENGKTSRGQVLLIKSKLTEIAEIICFEEIKFTC